jgi:polysaccharide export outer membrane protein
MRPIVARSAGPGWSGQESRMDLSRLDLRRVGRLLAPLWLVAAVGCQTVRTPEEQLAVTPIPRELNKTSMPMYVLAPPDLVIVEVLEALPGRPITGERLVRPDGTITLGFYGDVYVNGLTVLEAKEKIIIHLRQFLTDEALGLVGEDRDGNPIKIAPQDSDRIFVDVSAYNSQVYYVQGDVNAPGRLPITGNETVLDAVNYAGGLAPTASIPNVRLIRPAPPGACCAEVLPVNLAAIIQEGDTTTNYQLMPGDRLYVYRDPIVRTTIFLDRLAAPFNTVISSILQYTFVVRSVESLGIPLFTGGGQGGGTGAGGRSFGAIPANSPAN